MPYLFADLKFGISHIARYASSPKFQNRQKRKPKLGNLFFHHYYFEDISISKEWHHASLLFAAWSAFLELSR